MKVRFISLASGSSGNCYYIGTEKYGILIDAGIAVRTIKKGLKEAGIIFYQYFCYSLPFLIFLSLLLVLPFLDKIGRAHV